MEKINRHNYEAYFLDYLEGNLGAEEKQDLLIFLEQNPDLKKELDMDLSEVSLNPSATVFENKAALKVSEDTMLSLSSVETWMIESVEGNLSASQQQELDDFVRKHRLEKTYTAYQAAVLKADLNEVFEEKKKLKVSTGIVIPMYVRVAAIAAAVVLLIGVALNQPGDTEKENVSGNANMLASKTDAGEWARRIYEKNHSKTTNEFTTAPDNSTNVIQRENQREKPEIGIPGNMIAEDVKSLAKDTLKSSVNDSPDNSNIVNSQEDKKVEENVPVADDKNDVAIQSPTKTNAGNIVTEEPYKIVTTAASNVTKREVYFTRDRNTATNEYVAYGFKIGGFEFERKKQ